MATAQGQTLIITLLLEAGANIEAQNENGFTPLHYAAFFGRRSAIFTLLQAGANANAKNQWRKTPVDMIEEGMRLYGSLAWKRLRAAQLNGLQK